MDQTLIKQSKFNAYWQLTRMNRPIGALLLMWPTLWALFLSANGMPDIKVLVVFVVGVFLMRSAGCVINDYADRKVDGYVKRTKTRPIPSGLITEKQALRLFFSLVLLSFLLVLTMNRLTILLAFVGVVLAFIYPFMKRYTHFPQVFLGFAFGWSIPMAWAAQTGEVTVQAWLLFIINLFWTVVYDTQYAMVDRDDDINIGIKSTAIIFGIQDKFIIGVLQLLTIAVLVWLGQDLSLSAWYYLGVVSACFLFVYQQYLIKDRLRDPCFKAFLNNNYVGMVIFIGLLLHLFL